MTTTTNHIDHMTIKELIAILSNIPEGVDPDFDNTFQELEREFAERRLSFGNE